LTNEFSFEIVLRSKFQRCKLISKTNSGKDGFSVGLYDGKLWTTTHGVAENYSNVNIEEDKWNHILIVYNRGMVSYFLGGKLNQQVPGYPGCFKNESNLVIGQLGDNTNCFQGDIALVRIYNKALEKDVISNLPKKYPKNLCVFHLQFSNQHHQKSDEKDEKLFDLKSNLESSYHKKNISKLTYDLLPKLRIENFDLEDGTIIMLRSNFNTLMSTDDTKSYMFQTKKISPNCFFQVEILNDNKIALKQDNIIYFSYNENGAINTTPLICKIETKTTNEGTKRDLVKEIPFIFELELIPKNTKYFVKNCFEQFLSARYDFNGTYNFQKNQKAWELFDIIKFVQISDGKILIKSNDGKYLTANQNGSLALSSSRSTIGEDVFIISEAIPGKFIIQTTLYNTNISFPSQQSILGSYVTHQEKLTNYCFVQILNIGRNFSIFNSHSNMFMSFSKFPKNF
jgi:hypothetical protein